MRVRRWWKGAAEGALSAFRVLKRRSRRWGGGEWEAERRAVWIRVEWARVGGLKEESRIRRVAGEGVDEVCEGGVGVRVEGWTVWRTRKVEEGEEDWKSLRAVER
jgi:hypothetical protein